MSRCLVMYKRSVTNSKHLIIFFISYRPWISYLRRIVTVVSWCGQVVASVTVALCLSSIMHGTSAHHGKQEWIWSWNGLYICLHWIVCLPDCTEVIFKCQKHSGGVPVIQVGPKTAFRMWGNTWSLSALFFACLIYNVIPWVVPCSSNSSLQPLFSSMISCNFSLSLIPLLKI